MKKYILFLTGIAGFAGTVQAQKADTARAVVHYKFSHLRDTTQRDKPYTENMVLFVGATSSAYKSYDRKLQDALMKKQVADQIAEQKGNGGRINIKITGGPPTSRNEFYQFPLQHKLVRKERLITPYIIEEPMPAIDWKISADTASFSGLHCQKAVGHFKGRDYTAWFCADLPFHAGPWKLNGLPGLIVEAYDTNKQVVFKFDGLDEVTNTTAKPAAADAPGGVAIKMIGMDDANDDPNVIALPTDAVKTTEKEFKNLEAAMRKDPNAFAKSAMAGQGGGMHPGGGPGQGSGGGDQLRIQLNGTGPVINNPLELPEKKMSRMFKSAGVFIVWMLMGMVCLGQTIKGKITDTLGKPLTYAGINLKNSASIIIAYTTSDAMGLYSLNIPADADKNGLSLEASCIGFKKEVLQLSSFTVPYNFRLSAAVHQLQTVIVKDKRPRLRVSGDTISYKVSDFSSPQDRVIGDVIKKLPGINVDKDGKISYNGKAISNLYIGGDNLLDDKYNIATGTIPHGVVDQVQVMENHQPVKMLRDKVVSEDVALNLTIKKDAKLQLIGLETIGAGLPKKYDEDLNAMMFKDKYKAINYLRGNNTGYDVAGDLVSHNSAEYLQRVDNDKPGTILSLGTAGDPDLPRNRYLFNQSGVLNLNNLVNLKKDVQLRANISYLRDSQHQDYSKLSEVYLPGDTIRYTEKQNNKWRPDLIHTQFTININQSKYYLNDNLVTDYNRNTSYSSLVSNGVPVNQTFKDNLFDFSNELSFMKTFNTNKIIEVYSYVNRTTEPENRVITPNLNPDIFNNGINYSLLSQTANIPTWFTNNYLAYKIPGQYVTQSYKAGFSSQAQTLNSGLSVTQQNSVVSPVGDSTRNNLNWSRNKAYAEADYDIPGKILQINVNLPFSWQQTHYSDTYYQLSNSLNRLYFNPRLYVKYQSGIENYFSLNYGLRNNIGNIQDVYRGYILTNYRTLYANSADLTERQSQNAGLGFNYRKAITLFFFSVNVNYSHIYANNIASSILSNNLQQRVVLPFDNKTDAWAVSGYLSKYNFDLQTTFSAGASWQTAKLNQLQNGLVLPFNTVSETLNAGTETKVTDKLNLSYKANYSQTTSKSTAVAGSSKFQRLIQTAAVEYSPLTTLQFNISADHYYTHQQQANDLKYFFADATIRYKFSKPKIDVQLTAQNLFNVKNYTSLYLSANVFTTSTYNIPGRMMLAKVTFNL